MSGDHEVCPHCGDDMCDNPICGELIESGEKQRKEPAMSIENEIRPSVLAFAREMERVLHHHSATKGNQTGANGRNGWRDDDVDNLFEHLETEVAELDADLRAADVASAASEAIDVANMAMMVWDNLMQIYDALDPPDWDDLKRARRKHDQYRQETQR